MDVWDLTGETRREQIKELMLEIESKEKKKKDCNIIVAGDFNTVRKKDYRYDVNGISSWKLVSDEHFRVFNYELTQDLELLELNGLEDSFTRSKKYFPPHFTVWTGTVVDFFFLSKNFGLEIMGSYVHYNHISDHLPLILDLQKKY